MQRLSRLMTLCAAVALVAACNSSSEGDAPPPAAPAAPAAVAPTITQQPANAAVTVGQPASFAVAATGTDPLNYQWQRNGVDVAGANASSYTTAATVIGDSGATFRALVSNSAGSAASDSASLTVNAATGALVVALAAPTAGAQPKQIGLSWTTSGAGAGAITSYRVQLKPSDAAPYQLLPETFSGTTGTVMLPVGTLTWAQARIRVQGCDAALACTDSNEQILMGVLPALAGRFTASNAGAGDSFGGAIAISADGETIAIGAISEDSSATGIDGNQADDTASASGAVYVLRRTGGVWSQQAYIKASNAGVLDQFGWSLALSADGSTLAVGTPDEDSNATGVNGNQADNSATSSGAVYVFVRNGTTWTQQAYVKASNTGIGDDFGFGVALSADGDTLAVGARSEDNSATGINPATDNASASNSGAIYVFRRSGAAWAQQAYIKASNTGANDFFGQRLALAADGNTLAVGAPQEDSSATGIGGDEADNSALNSGAAFVFTRAGTTWSQQAYIKASNTGADDRLGERVALSADGNTLAVGAPNEDSNATGIDGNGADNSANDPGAAYVFTRTGSTWTQQAYVKANNTGNIDAFGTSIALSGDGNTLAVGAPNEDSNSLGVNGPQNDFFGAQGAIYQFRRNGTTWTQFAFVKAPSLPAGTIGNSVALSGDGSTLVMGAPITAMGGEVFLY